MVRIAILSGLLFAVPAFAQNAERAEERALQADAEARKLERQVADKASEVAAARERRRELAISAQAAERRATRLERIIASLETRRRKEVAALSSRRGEVSRLLAALQSMSRRPAAAALLATEDAIETARVAALIDAIRPELALKTQDLTTQLARTRRLRERAETRRGELKNTLAALAQRLAALDGEDAKLRKEGDAIGADAKAARERTRELAALAVDLKGLDDALAQSADARPWRRLRSYRPSAREIASFGYRAPAAGRITRAFGVPNEVGVLERGTSVATRGGAVVTAPAAGEIAYIGAYRNYGEIVIIEHENDMLTILSGLARTSGNVGDVVPGGTPIGRMGDDGDLYVELRRRGTPVDPMLYTRAP
ncbi:peptidoglycan DD-metalloendopeptidase family protein [Pacificimonas sp. WHA3]|uniref:Peptidoglycan DD-metalloendopeptidase family protein n=1 Tax=Pacificimonas pallii TaxID=2827236 RepID=A0ABS6SDG1_9SPHN|nr:peptidoglycan DD-metalloendopeptidase family protein [Pacificimonas pallii]MBV7256390.1 peptidoglycan DD-metalloendopeptidase family protein [Pacificimonas pallii]